jgi:hypothetical protein
MTIDRYESHSSVGSRLTLLTNISTTPQITSARYGWGDANFGGTASVHSCKIVAADYFSSIELCLIPIR